MRSDRSPPGLLVEMGGEGGDREGGPKGPRTVTRLTLGDDHHTWQGMSKGLKEGMRSNRSPPGHLVETVIRLTLFHTITACTASQCGHRCDR